MLDIKINAVGSSSLIKLRSFTASVLFITVKIICLSFPVKAPTPSQVVALRCSSFVIKSQMGFGFVHTTLKYLHKLMLSITLSINKDEIPNHNNEYKVVVMSKTKKLHNVITPFVTSNARPISRDVYFFNIMAIISVPPLEAPTLNKMADPRAGSIIAKQSSKNGSLVKGKDKGESHSSTEIEVDNKILQ